MRSENMLVFSISDSFISALNLTIIMQLTERFSAHFTNKIANLRQNMVNCTAPNYIPVAFRL